MPKTSRLQNRLSLLCLWVAAVCVGLNWAALQVVAWAGMTMANARTMDLPLALEKAMSGEQSCVVCRFANSQRDSDTESPLNFSQSAFDLEGVLVNPQAILDLRPFSSVPPERDDAFLQQCVPPPDPPPEKSFNYTS